VTSSTLLLPGVDQHGTGYRVRVRFGSTRHTETGFANPDAANARALELRRLRAAGLTPAQAPTMLTLRAAADQLLVRKRTAVSRKTRRRLRRRGIEWWERATRPWREGPFADFPLELLPRSPLEDAILARAAVTPKSARDELAGLLATLRYAGSRGASFDPALLTIERLPASTRARLALTVAEIDLLVRFTPAYAKRLVLFKSTVGNRISELFTLTDDRADLRDRTITIPAELCKEGVEKVIDLTVEEVALLREQLLARAPGTPLVFPTKTGRPWRHYQFLRLVWYKAIYDAAACWREQEGLPEALPTPKDRTHAAQAAVEWRAAQGLRTAAPTPFCDLEPHDLRATAATLMRDAGFPREQAAARLGHADSGALLDRIYDQGDRRARVRKAIDEFAPRGLRAALGEIAATAEAAEAGS
jgi:integrase